MEVQRITIEFDLSRPDSFALHVDGETLLAYKAVMAAAVKAVEIAEDGMSGQFTGHLVTKIEKVGE